MQVFSASIVKLGINACVNVPEKTVKSLLAAAGKKSAPVQVKCDLNGAVFDANVVRYSGNWRLYLNTPMRKSAKKDVGDKIKIKLSYDPTVRMPPTPEPSAKPCGTTRMRKKPGGCGPRQSAAKSCNPSTTKRPMPNSRATSPKQSSFS